MKTYPYISTKATDKPISTGDAKEWLRMDLEGYNGDDSAIEAALFSACSQVETICNLSLEIDTYTWITFCFPCSIPTKYVRTITSIEYWNGTEYVTIDSAGYRLLKTGEISNTIKYTADLPDLDGNEVKIVFTAGFNDAPKDLLKAIRALLAQEFDGRENAVEEKRTLADNLMNNYRTGYAG